jgi:ABC-2 type transport system ATP-binding protein
MIEVDRLSKRFGPVTAVDDLSFTVRPGRVTGFLGPTGAGKTTTMRVILGLDAPTSGQALVAGHRYDGLIRPLREVGSLLDATALHPGRTAWSHVLSIAQANGIGRPRVTDVLRLTGLEGVARRRAGGFSLGMKQRLGIAVAMLGDPPVLMFDEPVNGLDPEGIHWIRGFFRELAADGRTARRTGPCWSRWSPPSRSAPWSPSPSPAAAIKGRRPTRCCPGSSAWSTR